jgi:hypothetical protein
MILHLLTDHCPLGTSPPVMATQTAAAGAKTFIAEEKNACGIDAMLDCEACE